jgi:hypothetical protein
MSSTFTWAIRRARRYGSYGAQSIHNSPASSSRYWERACAGPLLEVLDTRQNRP